MTDKMPRGRNAEVTADDVIDAAKEIDAPAFGVRDIAEQLPVGQESIRGKLGDLADEGVLVKRKIGNANVYWFDCF